MCYHIAFDIKLPGILEIFPDLVIDHQLEIDFPTASYINGFDHKPQPVMLTGRKDGKRHLALMMWGFLPDSVRNSAEAENFWNGYKDENGRWQKGYLTLNAMGEELFERTLYKDAAFNRRCVIFIEGFYEWYHHFPIGKQGQRLKTAVKYPHHIFLNSPYNFAMVAGIWNPWRHEEVNEQTGALEKLITPTFALVTTEANELMAKIHNSKKRMPTFLTKELAEEWLQSGLSRQRITEIATHQWPAEKMEAYPIAKNFQEIVDPKTRQHYSELDAEFC